MGEDQSQDQSSQDNQQQEPSRDWKDGLTDDLKNSPALKDVGNVESLAKQFVDLQSHLGNTIRTPAKDATPEELTNFANKVIEHSKGKLIMAPDLAKTEQAEDFYRSIGKPEAPDKYQLPELEGIEINPDNYSKFREAAHKYNLTNSQFKQMVETIERDNINRKEAVGRLKKDELTKLKNEWGMDYDRRMQVASNILEGTNAPQDYIDIIKNGNADADTYKWLFNLSQQLSGEKVEIAKQSGGARNDTPLEIRARIKELEDRIAVLDKDSNVAKRKKQSEIMNDIIELRRKLK